MSSRPLAATRLVVGVVLPLACLVLTGPAARAQPPGRIADIRVHGNHTTPDADIIALSGLTRGAPATDDRLRAAERRLRDSGRFAGVELRRRLASIEDASAILVMIVIDEHAAVRANDLAPGPLDRLRSASMWLPIVGYADGYGFTYGGRVSLVDVLGPRSRVSVPMTWGGERRIAIEAERSFDGPVRVVRGSAAVTRRVNPHFDAVDVRQEGRVEAERPLLTWLRAGAGARIAQVGFGGGGDARHAAAGVHAAVDTRVDPSFPRNAVHARIGWERLWFSGAEAAAADGGRRAPGSRAGRWNADLRGYLGVVGASVLAVRGQAAVSDAPLPPAEQALLGGSDSLRGYRAGHRADDNIAAVSAELRVPVSSALSAGRLGVKAFVDAGAAWSSGERLAAQRFERGVGAGIYLGAAALTADVDIAWPERGKPRVHVGLGVSF